MPRFGPRVGREIGAEQDRYAVILECRDIACVGGLAPQRRQNPSLMQRGSSSVEASFWSGPFNRHPPDGPPVQAQHATVSGSWQAGAAADLLVSGVGACRSQVEC
jgi:hypothetical protein